jgi:hypothetical protein
VTRADQRTAALCLSALGFTPAQIVRLFLIAGLPIPDLTQLRASTHTNPERSTQ